MSQQIIVYVGFAGLVVALTLASLRAWSRMRSTNNALATTAQARGWTYQARGQAQVDVGEIFGEPNRGVYLNVIQGTAADTPFVAFEYVPPSNGEHGFVLLNLPKFLPVLEVRPAGAVSRAVWGTEYGLPLVQFESVDFNARFSVRSSDAKFASDVITPRLMQVLLAAPPLNWRIMDGCLVSWTNSPLTPLQIVSTVPSLRVIYDAIPGFVWERYGSSQPAAFDVSPEPAAVGATTQPGPTPPGWYPDPNDPTMARWWNGTAWTSSHGTLKAR